MYIYAPGHPPACQFTRTIADPGERPPTTSMASTVPDSLNTASRRAFFSSVTCASRRYSGLRDQYRGHSSVHVQLILEALRSKKNTPKEAYIHIDQVDLTLKSSHQAPTKSIMHSTITPCCASTRPSVCSWLPRKESCCRCGGISVAKKT